MQQVPNGVLHAARFEWPALAPLTFVPSLGHLPAGAVKDIVVTYLSEKPVQLKATVTTLKAAQLKVPVGTAASDWDNRVVAGSAAAAPEPKLEIASAKEAMPLSVPLKVQPQLLQDVTACQLCCVVSSQLTVLFQASPCKHCSRCLVASKSRGCSFTHPASEVLLRWSYSTALFLRCIVLGDT